MYASARMMGSRMNVNMKYDEIGGVGRCSKAIYLANYFSQKDERSY